MTRVLSIFFLLFILFSCKKQSNCSGDCADIQISGQVVDSSNNTGIPNVQIQLFWTFRGMGFGDPLIATTNTDIHGNFKLTTTIDKSEFQENYLRIKANIPNNYLGNTPTDTWIDNSINEYHSEVNNLRFVMFSKTLLNIKVQRTQTDVVTYFTLVYQYNQSGMGLWSIRPVPFADTTLQVQTESNIYTKILWTKYSAPGHYVDYVDSIRCLPSANNIYTLSY